MYKNFTPYNDIINQGSGNIPLNLPNSPAAPEGIELFKTHSESNLDVQIKQLEKEIKEKKNQILEKEKEKKDKDTQIKELKELKDITDENKRRLQNIKKKLNDQIFKNRKELQIQSSKLAELNSTSSQIQLKIANNNVLIGQGNENLDVIQDSKDKSEEDYKDLTRKIYAPNARSGDQARLNQEGLKFGLIKRGVRVYNMDVVGFSELDDEMMPTDYSSRCDHVSTVHFAQQNRSLIQKISGYLKEMGIIITHQLAKSAAPNFSDLRFMEEDQGHSHMPGEYGDSCKSSNDGQCDDGGCGSLYSTCDHGTDVVDCGRR
mgnify:CR=1 FL=1